MSRFPRSLVAALAIVVSVLVVAPVSATAATDSSASLTAGSSEERAMQRPLLRKVPMSTFGIHSYQGKPRGVTSGAIRVNCSPFWNQIQPSRGVFKWAEADRVVNAAHSYYPEVLFTFCKTPAWAAQRGIPANVAPPAQMDDWRRFVRAVVTRYKGKIDAYEVWNEATSPYWWRGTPAQMAAMTVEAAKIIRSVDPAAKVVSPSIQCCQQLGWFNSFFPKFAKAMAAAGWPIDVLALHTYVDKLPADITATQGMTVRADNLALFRRAMIKAKVPSRVQVWDSETNFLLPTSTRMQQAILSRTYFDSWRFGLARTYWYMWAFEPPWWGIRLAPGSQVNNAYNTVVSWTKGAKFRGCHTGNVLVECDFQRRSGSFTVAYATTSSGRQKLRFKKPTRVCDGSGSACSQARRSFRVTYMPVKIG